MSRTYKDRPYWVLENKVGEEIHDHTRMGEGTTKYKTIRGKDLTYHRPDECTIGEDKLEHPSTSKNERYDCFYSLSGVVFKKYYGRYSPPNDILHHDYWHPLRAAERVTLTAAAKEYNTYGDIEDDIYLAERHRHSTYKGGYWD